MFKKTVSVLLSALMLLTVAPVAIASTDEKTGNPSVDEILDDFHERILEVNKGQGTGTYSVMSVKEKTKRIKKETIERLNEAGYEAYDLNPQTLTSVEDALRTDFGQMGLDPNGSYIVVAFGEDGAGASTNVLVPPIIEPGGGTFKFTYGGITYTMRYLAVTAEDGYDYFQSKSVTLINSPVADYSSIENILNATISFVLDKIGDEIPIGTIGAMCGLTLVDIEIISETPKRFDPVLNTSAQWTRYYTQILEPNNYWNGWSCVERVNNASYLSGYYYSAKTKSAEKIPENETKSTGFSEHYTDNTWRNTDAVRGYLTQYFRGECTGDAKFYYKEKEVFAMKGPALAYYE